MYVKIYIYMYMYMRVVFLNSFQSMCMVQTNTFCVRTVYVYVGFFFCFLWKVVLMFIIYILTRFGLSIKNLVYFSIIKISLSHNRTSISYGLRNFAIIKPMTVFSFINRPSKLYIKHASNVEKWTT